MLNMLNFSFDSLTNTVCKNCFIVWRKIIEQSLHWRGSDNPIYVPWGVSTTTL